MSVDFVDTVTHTGRYVSRLRFLQIRIAWKVDDFAGGLGGARVHSSGQGPIWRKVWECIVIYFIYTDATAVHASPEVNLVAPGDAQCVIGVSRVVYKGGRADARKMVQLVVI